MDTAEATGTTTGATEEPDDKGVRARLKEAITAACEERFGDGERPVRDLQRIFVEEAVKLGAVDALVDRLEELNFIMTELYALNQGVQPHLGSRLMTARGDRILRGALKVTLGVMEEERKARSQSNDGHVCDEDCGTIDDVVDALLRRVMSGGVTMVFGFGAAEDRDEPADERTDKRPDEEGVDPGVVVDMDDSAPEPATQPEEGEPAAGPGGYL